MIKKHRAKTGKNASHGNAGKDVNRIVRSICAIEGVSTCIPGKIKPAKGGSNNAQVKFQRMDGDTKMKYVIRLRNVLQELIVIVPNSNNISLVKKDIQII